MIAAVPLQHLDLVAVRVLHEEEARQQLAVAVELDDVARVQTRGLEARVLEIEVMPISSTA